jgi:GMP synthase-like glutamine amidotransferase
VLVIEQDERLEGLGLLGKRLEALSVPFRRLKTWQESPSGLRARDFAGIVPLGGSASAWHEDEHPFLRDERLLLAEAVEHGVPVLGICLGAQLLARALGAQAAPAGVHEAGWCEIAPTPAAADDPLFRHVKGRVGAYQWHVDVFELPEGAVHLATSDLLPHQAFRLGEAWGVQFHPEVDYDTFASWLANHPGACEASRLDEEALHEAVRVGAAESHAWRSRLFDAFAERCTGP